MRSQQQVWGNDMVGYAERFGVGLEGVNPYALIVFSRISALPCFRFDDLLNTS
jgi:hypothetical protein